MFCWFGKSRKASALKRMNSKKPLLKQKPTTIPQSEENKENVNESKVSGHALNVTICC